jgi:hypothetical protein
MAFTNLLALNGSQFAMKLESQLEFCWIISQNIYTAFHNVLDIILDQYNTAKQITISLTQKLSGTDEKLDNWEIRGLAWFPLKAHRHSRKVIILIMMTNRSSAIIA